MTLSLVDKLSFFGALLKLQTAACQENPTTPAVSCFQAGSAVITITFLVLFVRKFLEINWALKAVKHGISSCKDLTEFSLK